MYYSVAMTNISLLKKRMEIIKEIREFFYSRNYLEVETPILSPFLIPESHIEIFGTKQINPYGDERNFYLTPSPEIWMKKLLAEGSGSIFQITKSFRNSEQIGSHHNPEFTMLEWYTVDFDYKESIDITESLFDQLSEKFNCPFLKPPFEKISMQDIFEKYTSINLEQCYNLSIFSEKAKTAGYNIKENYNWEEIFNFLFVSVVEPAIKEEQKSPVLIYDYPDQIPCLAKRSKKGPWYERWELYVKGIEIINCYTEESYKKLTDLFFREQIDLRKKSLTFHAVDKRYTDIFSNSFPECSGAAIGVDRLVMAITEAKTIQDVISYTF